MKSSFLLSLFAIALSGCGGSYDASVSGKATLDGNPLPRGTVTFSPTSPGPSAYGNIATDGSYYVSTGREAGLSPGNYEVTVVSNERPTQQGRDGGPPPMGKPITPKWYRNPKSSGLQFDVQPGSNEINLELTSDPPAGWDSKERPRR